MPFFCDADAGFLPALCRKFRPEMFLAGDALVFAGDQSQQLFLVTSGVVVSRDSRGIVHGRHVGPVALGFETFVINGTCTTELLAETEVHAFVIQRNDFLDAVKVHAGMAERFKRILHLHAQSRGSAETQDTLGVSGTRPATQQQQQQQQQQ